MYNRLPKWLTRSASAMQVRPRVFEHAEKRRKRRPIRPSNLYRRSSETLQKKRISISVNAISIETLLQGRSVRSRCLYDRLLRRRAGCFLHLRQPRFRLKILPRDGETLRGKVRSLPRETKDDGLATINPPSLAAHPRPL